MNPKKQILEEMGYTLWQLRQESPAENPARQSAKTPQQYGQDHQNDRQDTEIDTAMTTMTAMSAVNFRAKLGSPPEDKADGRARQIAAMGWEELSSAVQECRACELCQQRKQAVLGVGSKTAKCLFIGEGPGAEEDAQGEPFVGQAGKLLDAMLSAIGLKRGENVYIANAVKCRPEGNRNPHPSETAACKPFLSRQIELLQPRLIVLLGKVATHSVLGEDRSLASMRQKQFQHKQTPALVTYHPAYLLRNLPDKAKAWEDLCLIRATLERL